MVILILGLVGLMTFYAFPLEKRINLGLNLKGGMHFLLKVDISQLPKERIPSAVEHEVDVVRREVGDEQENGE